MKLDDAIKEIKKLQKALESLKIKDKPKNNWNTSGEPITRKQALELSSKTLEDTEEERLALDYEPDNTYIYEIGYYSPEDSKYEYLVSDTRYTSFQIEEMFIAAAVFLVVPRIKELVEYTEHKEYNTYPILNFSDLFLDLPVIETMCEIFNFRKLELEQYIRYSGWDNILNFKGIEGTDNSDDRLRRRIRRILPQKLKDRLQALKDKEV